MQSHSDNRSSIFTFPILFILTATLCLVSYQAFGLNTALGVATCSAVLSFTLNRKSKSPAAE